MNNTDTSNSLLSKKNLKWFESRIENFNNVVPYQISCLTSYKNNILQQYRLGNFTALKQERISAERTIRNLKQLLVDIDRLREQVKDTDLNKFDKLVFHSRENVDNALKNFNDLYKSLDIPHDTPESRRARHYYSDYENDAEDDPFQKQVILKEHEDVWEAKQRKEIADSMEVIEKDVQTVNEIFRDLAQIVNEQKEYVDTLEDNVEVTHECVTAAEKELAQAAAKIHGAAYPLVGALLGSCIGGPIGFLAGLKIGTVAAVTCSVLGFSGGKALKMKQQRMQKQILENVPEQRTIKS